MEGITQGGGPVHGGGHGVEGVERVIQDGGERVLTSNMPSTRLQLDKVTELYLQGAS